MALGTPQYMSPEQGQTQGGRPERHLLLARFTSCRWRPAIHWQDCGRRDRQGPRELLVWDAATGCSTTSRLRLSARHETPAAIQRRGVR
jgi:hypothetical protein